MASLSTGHESEPRNKGNRIRELRHLTKLSREKFVEGTNVSLGSFKYWEEGHGAGLTEKGAKKLVRVFASKGIDTSVDWLLYGLAPFKKRNANENLLDEAGDELTNFYKKYPEAVHLIVPDDRLYPTIKTGMIIAGRKKFTEGREQYYSEFCIVSTQKGDTYFGMLLEGKKKDEIHLGYTNPTFASDEITLPISQVLYIAPICWIRSES